VGFVGVEIQKDIFPIFKVNLFVLYLKFTLKRSVFILLYYLKVKDCFDLYSKTFIVYC